jgi:predicted nucleic acid-binding protein
MNASAMPTIKPPTTAPGMLSNPPKAAAANLAADYSLRGADAVYATVALAHGCDLVSLDHEHITRLASVLQVRTPAQWLVPG